MEPPSVGVARAVEAGDVEAGPPSAVLESEVALPAGTPAESVYASAATATATASLPVLDRRTMARQRGFEGDPCAECGQMMMVRNGTCLKCMNCGATSGCS